MNGVREMHIGYWWKARRKETTRKTKSRWVDNIKMDLLEIGWDCVNWIELVQDWDKRGTLVNAVMNLRVPRNAGNTIGGRSSSAQFQLVCLVL
jgi:aryl carrier-like protein